MLTRNEAATLFERRRRAWLDENLDAYLELFAPELEFQSPNNPEPLRGRDAFAALVHRSAAFSRPESFDFHELSVDGDVVLAEWTIAIRRRDTDRRIQWRGMSVCRIRDGLITKWREYWNPSDLA
jgi:limonene-1,2-epoxide hydrolase